MVFAIILSTISLGAILYQIWLFDRILENILSIYAHLKIANIREVYSRCFDYMEELTRGSFIEQIHAKENPGKQERGELDLIAEEGAASNRNEEIKD